MAPRRRPKKGSGRAAPKSPAKAKAAPKRRGPRKGVDERDRAILGALQEDSRRSVRALAGATGLRPSTVHQRLGSLVSRGIIRRFTVDIDEEAVGKGMVVFMLVSGELDTYLDDEFLREGPVLEVFGITGEFDLLLKMRFAGMGEFNRFLIAFRERYSSSVHKTITMVSTAQLKEQRVYLGEVEA